MTNETAIPSSPYSDDLDAVMEQLAEEMNPAAVPENADEYYTESLSEVLVRSIGYFAVCEFLIGSGGLVEKYGVLFAAGNNFVTLYDRENDSYTTCDLYSLKFVTIYNSHVRPSWFTPRQGGRAPQQGNSMPGRSTR